MALLIVYLPSQSQAEQAISCDQYQVNGGDEAFLMNLNTPLKWGDTVYSGNIYTSPKGTVTFGQGDYTFWDYPQTPSISIAAFDYHAFANGVIWGAENNLYVRYGSTTTSVCIDWKVMLWGQSTGEPIYIRMIAYVDPVTYEWTPTYQVSSNAPLNARYGARYVQSGPITPLEIQFISEAPEPEPTSIPTQDPTPEPTPEPTEEPSPETEPTPEPTPEPSEPSLQPLPEPQPTTTQNPYPTPNLTQNPEREEISQQIEKQEEIQQKEEQSTVPSKETTPIVEEIIDEEPIISEEKIKQEALKFFNPEYKYKLDEIIPLANTELEKEELLKLLKELDPNQPIEYVEGVVIEAGVAAIFVQLADPAALFQEILSNPSQVVEALGQLGVDMTEEEREESEKVIVAAVIVSQLIGSVTATAIVTQVNARTEIRRIV